MSDFFYDLAVLIKDNDTKCMTSVQYYQFIKFKKKYLATGNKYREVADGG